MLRQHDPSNALQFLARVITYNEFSAKLRERSGNADRNTGSDTIIDDMFVGDTDT
jgi:hypothetical protein